MIKKSAFYSFFAAAVLLSAGALWANGSGSGGDTTVQIDAASFLEQPVFPKATCNVTEAMGTAANLARANPVPVWDGNGPWPGVLGYWGSESRAVFTKVEMYKKQGAKFGFVQVTFYDVCNQRVLAVGSRPILKKDFDRKTFTLNLENRGLNGEAFTATFRSTPTAEEVANSQSASSIEIRIRETTDLPDGTSREAVLRDVFRAEKL